MAKCLLKRKVFRADFLENKETYILFAANFTVCEAIMSTESSERVAPVARTRVETSTSSVKEQ